MLNTPEPTRAVLPRTLTSVSDSVPLLAMPPPTRAESSETVTLVNLASPLLYRPPPRAQADCRGE